MEPGRLGPSVAEALRASVSPCVKRRLGGWFGRADTPRAQRHSWPAVPSAQGGRGHLTPEAHPAGTPKRRSHQMAGTGQAPPFSHPQGRSPGQETQTNGSRRQTSERRHSSFQQAALPPPPPSLLARGPTTAPRSQHCCLASARRDPSPSTPGPGWASPPRPPGRQLPEGEPWEPQCPAEGPGPGSGKRSKLQARKHRPVQPFVGQLQGTRCPSLEAMETGRDSDGGGLPRPTHTRAHLHQLLRSFLHSVIHAFSHRASAERPGPGAPL